MFLQTSIGVKDIGQGDHSTPTRNFLVAYAPSQLKTTEAPVFYKNLQHSSLSLSDVEGFCHNEIINQIFKNKHTITVPLKLHTMHLSTEF